MGFSSTKNILAAFPYYKKQKLKDQPSNKKIIKKLNIVEIMYTIKKKITKKEIMLKMKTTKQINMPSLLVKCNKEEKLRKCSTSDNIKNNLKKTSLNVKS